MSSTKNKNLPKLLTKPNSELIFLNPKLPVSESIFTELSFADFVKIFTTPPIASEPHRVDWEPLKTSILSILDVSKYSKL